MTAAGDLATVAKGEIGDALMGRGVENAFRNIVTQKVGFGGKVLNFAEQKGYILMGKTNKGPDILGWGKGLQGTWWDITTRKSWDAGKAFKYPGQGIGFLWR